jgi:hypothetical protein
VIFKKITSAFGKKPELTRRMEDDMPSFRPPNSTDSLSALERERLNLNEWYARLDPDLRPANLFRDYPQIARQIVAIWGQPPQCNAFLDQLLIAEREGRQGFPPAVAQELLALGAFYKEKYRDLIGLRNI